MLKLQTTALYIKYDNLIDAVKPTQVKRQLE